MKILILSIISAIIIVSIPGAYAEPSYYVGTPITLTCDDENITEDFGYHFIDISYPDGSGWSTGNHSIHHGITIQIEHTFTPTASGDYHQSCYYIGVTYPVVNTFTVQDAIITPDTDNANLQNSIPNGTHNVNEPITLTCEESVFENYINYYLFEGSEPTKQNSDITNSFTTLVFTPSETKGYYEHICKYLDESQNTSYKFDAGYPIEQTTPEPFSKTLSFTCGENGFSSQHKFEIKVYDDIDELRYNEYQVNNADSGIINLSQQTVTVQFEEGNYKHICVNGTEGQTEEFFTVKETNSYSERIEQAKKKNGGGCSGDCTPPTFGKNKHGIMIVQGGFSLNGNTVDVDSYHTEYPLIELDIGTQYNIKLKSYENYNANNFKWFQIGFGMPGVGVPLNDAEVLLTIYMNHTGIDRTEIRDGVNLIEFTDFTTSVENCGYIISDCRVISVDFIPRETLYNNVLTIQAVDRSRNSGVNHLNDGIEFTGESLNLPQTDKMWTKHSNQNRGIWLQLTEVNKFTNTWEDENGIQYLKYNGQYSRTTPMEQYECTDKISQSMNRLNCQFQNLKEFENQKALLIIESHY